MATLPGSPVRDRRQPTVKTRVLVLSDTHSQKPFATEQIDRPYREPLPRADVLLHCGDLTMWGRIDEYRHVLKMLKNIDAELKLVIAGNHDLTLDPEYCKMKNEQGKQNFSGDIHEQAIDLWKGTAARDAGVTYLEEGTHTFNLSNGAKLRVYATPWQPEFCNLAFNYDLKVDRFNTAEQRLSTTENQREPQNPVPNYPLVDVMMSHGPPKGHLDLVKEEIHVGCPHLLRAASRSRPRLYCFGHIHEGWGAEHVIWKDKIPESVRQDDQATEVEKESVRIDRERDDEDVLEDRCAYVDMTKESPASYSWQQEFGNSTLMINASIMTLGYRPINAPWVVDLDLPAVESNT